MSQHQLLSLAVDIATLAVLTATLLFVKKYTKAAADTAKAALEQARLSATMAEASIEQAEATHRPCVIVRTIPDRSFDADLEESAPAMLGALKVTFENVGSGPAINLNYKFEIPGRGAMPKHSGLMLRAGEPLVTEVTTNMLAADTMLTLEYESRTGARYRTNAAIDRTDRGWFVQQLAGLRLST